MATKVPNRNARSGFGKAMPRRQNEAANGVNCGKLRTFFAFLSAQGALGLRHADEAFFHRSALFPLDLVQRFGVRRAAAFALGALGCRIHLVLRWTQRRRVFWSIPTFGICGGRRCDRQPFGVVPPC